MTTFGGILNRYGAEATLHGEDLSTVRCFIQPILSRHTGQTWSRVEPLGERDMARYYGFFPAEACLKGCTHIACGGKEYDVLRAEPLRVMGQVSHWEALLRARAEDADE